MKLMNCDKKDLIYQNMRADVQRAQKKPQTYTKTQYGILCRLIQQKKVTEQFFNFLLESLFELKDWQYLP